MPEFSVLVVRHLEQSATLIVEAKDSTAADAKVEKLIETKTWQELTEEAEVSEDSENISVEEVVEI